MSKTFLLFLLLTVVSSGLVLARPQAGSTTASPSTGSTPNGGANAQNIRGAPCRGPPAVGQYKFN